MNIRQKFKEFKRIVVKVGTSTLTYENGKINLNRLEKLVRVLADLSNQGKDIVLVTSGAIGVGMSKMNMEKKPDAIGEKQAAAAVGQSELMHMYSKLFSEYGCIVAQILLTRSVINDQVSRRNIINTLENLFLKKIIPIVNENDSVSVEEIEDDTARNIFGDNDTLSIYVAKIIEADILIMLTDIDGFYDCDPRHNDCANFISEVNEITAEMEQCAGDNGTQRGTGGMNTKIQAAKVALDMNIAMVIANGEEPDVVRNILNGEKIGSLFINR